MNLKRFRHILFITILMVLFPIDVFGSKEVGTLERFQEMDSRRLLEKGEKWLSVSEGADSALMCFSIVGARYANSSSRVEKELAVKALRGKWLVYFSYLYDYPKAYEAIQEALKICRDENIDNADVQISLGGLLQVMADLGGSSELYREAVSAYSSGLREAVKRKEYKLADRAFVNLVSTSVALGSADSLKSVWPLYEAIPVTAEAHRRRFAKVLYKTLVASPPAGLGQEVDLLLEEVKRLPDEPEYARLRYIGLKSAAELSFRSLDTSRGLNLAKEAYGYAADNGIIDGEMEAALLLSQFQKRLGMTKESSESYDRYLRLKDKIIGSRLIQRLDELRFVAEIQQADKKMALLHEEKKRQMWVIGLLSLIVVTIAGAVLVVVSRNRKLSEANQALRRQFELSVATENRERRLLKMLEEESKYSKSSLSETERERILHAIHKIVESPETVCAPDFTIGKMAEVAGCNAKYLSQVINEEFGCNFNTLINKYRINEAARRLADDGGEWQRLTIEGIANSVGFKSRSTFVALFKQFTGTTPSDYRRSAASNKIERG